MKSIFQVRVNMTVSCPKCGFENSEDSNYCLECGATLKMSAKKKRAEEWGEEFGRKMEKWGEDFGKQVEVSAEEFGRTIENECFGLPHGGAIIGLIIGAFIIIIGASLALDLDFDIWGRWFGTGILIIIGIIIVISAIYGLTRKKRR